MKILKLIVIVCCMVLTTHINSQTVLIDYAASWEYYDNANEPADNGGMDWNDINYNSSSWDQGNAQLGYGDNDENTLINSNTKTAYFRKNFNVVDPAAFDGVELDLIYDDGVVVYLNGTEVWRVNMPNGTIDYSTFASTSSSDNDIAANTIANSLVAGDNVIAVEVHQVSNGSSDISFDFKATATIPGAVSISRGPYLQKASASNITVRYRTASATQTIIKYGTNINNLNQTYSNTTPKTEHIADISGLSPNTTYYYRLENSAAVLLAESTDIYFRTHPTIGTEQPIRMWILGDCGTANNDQRDVRDAYYNYVGTDHTDGILFLGDNAYNDGTDAQYQNAIFNNMYEDKLQNSVAWSCLGNHDGYSTNSNSQTGPYYDIFSFPTAGESGGVASGTEAYYSFDYGNIHFIALESYQTDRSVGGAMYNWALNDIQSTTQDWIVAYWHHPPYTKGSHDSDSETNLIQMRQNFLPMLESNGVDLVLSGHSHSYERSYFLNGHYGNANTFNSSNHTVGANGYGNGQSNGNGVYDKTITGANAGEGAVYITTGSSGKISGGSLNHQAMYYSVSQLGSCVLEVDGSQLDVKFVRETGAIDDYFTILKEEDCVVGTSCDDGDTCTTNDTYDSNCDCVGTDLPDSDNDGICDAEDQCPNLDNALIGTACDDGDSGTENDIYGQDCICAGVPCSPAGTSCDDGDTTTYNDQTDGNCNCIGTPCPTAGTSCDDGDPNTINDVEDGFCNCAGESTSATTCITINSGADDVEENGTTGVMYSNSTDIELVYDTYQSAGNQTIGLRFNAVDVPQGATITNAYIQFTADEVNTGTVNLTIEGEDVDNASSFPTSTYNISNRTKTQANVSWSPPNWNTIGAQTLDQQTPDISSIIQEIVDRPGYSINNSMVIVITGTGERTAESYDGSAPQAPQLCIEYSTASCQTQGNTCDDGNNCTINDVIDANCDCAGTFQDSDSDGVCDADDICQGGDDNIDSDNDGIPDFCDSCDGNTVGNSCDDGNACTTNDVIDANCNCAGTFQDSDLDGVCDADDICQGGDDNVDSDNDGIPDFCDSCDGNTVGNSCDDGNDCTTNDVIDANCDCAGTFQDSDSDGVCDADDICPDGDDNIDSDNDGIPDFCDSCDGNTLGNPCDDGNNCTTNDVIDANCNCAGTFQDSDSDGVCDADDICQGGDDNIDSDNDGIPDFCDSCDGNTVGNSCDDGNACTTNDVIDANCDCAGTFQDSDSDGVCDADDICQGGDDNIDSDNDGIPDFCDSCDGNTVGNSCDDGNACTTNDVIDANCNCAGTFQDSDLDGVCDADDICPDGDDNIDSDNDGIPDFCDSCDGNTVGNSCDDGNDCTTNDVIDANCNCAGTFQDSDSDGVCDADDICPDGDDNIDSDNDGIPDFCDSCDGNTVGNSCDDGNDCTTNDVIDANCNCAGTFQDSDSDGVCDADDICPDGDDNIDSDNDGIPDFCDSCDGNTVGNSCDDGNDCTTNDVIDANCNCAGTFQDSDSDGVCDADDICQGGDDNIDSDNDGIPDFCDSCDGNTVGNPCDDGNACTTNDVIDANCDCAGTFQDSDLDGVCDADDICQGGDDNVDSDNDGIPDFCDSCDGNTVGNTCDDGNACTTNDVIDANCDCAGTFQDSDNDGVCDANDICAGGDDNIDSDNDGIPDFCDSCDGNTVGNSCDDGNACTTNDVIDANCDCAGTFQDSDLDGVCDADDICQGGDDNVDSDNDGIPDFCDSCDGNTVGNTCDDGNACTTNDVIDANCDCAGTFQDSDSDGVCDADDICQGGDDNIDSDNDGIPDFCDSCDGNTVGNSCDDGNACTTNDVIDANCDCAGTFQDSDSDGVCDADDICPGSDDNQDDDNDGIPNGCDDCDGNTVGNTCDDGNDCTTNDVVDANCNCAGTFQDSDSDGVCDADDICPDGDDNIDSDNDGIPDFCDSCDGNTVGNSCDDGNDCTTNDVIDANCNCAGTFQDSDSDGVCDADDICPDGDDNIDSDNDGIPDFCDSCDGNTVGNSCDDGNDCTTNDVIDANCNCAGAFQDSDSDGVCDADDICPGSDDNQDDDNDGIPNGCDNCDENTVGNSCDDGNDCTTNDVIDANCNCAGAFQDSDSDGVCDADDICPGSDDNQDDDNDGIPNGCDDCDGNTVGNSCDDGNDCTNNDVIDANCNCAGTFQDSDSDGVCDADDICPGSDDNQDDDNDGIPNGCDDCDGNTVGNSCDDGNNCTINDVIDANCNCAGTFQDSDSDGVCDADDICPGSDDNQDDDNDGIPNGCDTCDGNTVGNSCDDGNDCTTNDVIDANCNCAGTFQDSDSDGVCDADDICPGSDDNQDDDNDGIPNGCDSCDGNTVGNSCDDGNDCTTNDVIDANCNCAGTFQDSDSDGVCDADDICPDGDDNIDSDNDGIPDFCDACDGNTVGNSCDDGDACTSNDVIDANCNCAGTFQDSDSDGVCDADDICQGGDDNIDSDNDGTPDFCDTDCTDTDNDGQCDEDDPCPLDEYDACTLPNYCNSTGNNTSYEYIERVVLNTIDNTSGDDGGYADYTNLNTTLSNGLSYDIQLTPGFVSNSYNEVWAVWIDFNKDGDFDDTDEAVLQANSSGTINSTITIPNTVLNGITRMRVSMQYNSAPPSCSNFTYGEVEDYYVIIENNCSDGDPCDDGDECTENDVYDIDCNCAGTMISDSDGDGVCDAIDVCPGMDDALIGQACDDNDNCTVNDVYNSNCNCEGTYQDADNDGFCVGDDPDDNDACNPNSESPECTPCDEIMNHGFENGYGAWNDGGGDCTRRTQFPNTGIYSVRLRDNSGSASSMTSDMLDLTAYSELTFVFSYWPNSMENGEDFLLEISTNNGSSYSTVQSWVRGTDFNNGVRYDEEVVIDNITFTNQMRLRLRCDASGNGDQIYVDDVILTGCDYSSGMRVIIIDKNGNNVNGSTSIISTKFEQNPISSSSYEFENFENDLYEAENDEEFLAYPNPTRDFIYLNGTWDDESNEIELFDIYGQKLLKKSIARDTDENVKIDISHLPSGIYIINFMQSNEVISAQKVVITNN